MKLKREMESSSSSELCASYYHLFLICFKCRLFARYRRVLNVNQTIKKRHILRPEYNRHINSIEYSFYFLYFAFEAILFVFILFR